MNSHSTERFAIGLDFGTLSGRALVVRVRDGAELGSATMDYPHGVMDQTLAATGAKLPPEWALQDPQDYLEVLKYTVPEALRHSGINPQQVVGIGLDFTSCTILPVTADGTPLSLLEGFRNRPHAYVKLWKHHAAQPQADRINALAQARNEAWLPRYGGKTSSEWVLPKALQILEEDPDVYRAATRIIEAGDWLVWQLCGCETRSISAAGYKASFQDGQYPSPDFLAGLNPDFADFPIQKLSSQIAPLGARAGGLTAQAAAWTGLPEGIAVAVANVDAHVAVPAANAVQPGQMVLIMGTSTCQIVNGEHLVAVPGMSGAVDGGVSPGLYGYEAGQSAVGDIFGWFVKHAVPPEYHQAAQDAGVDVHAYLTGLAEHQRPGEHGLMALDWWNGNRSVLMDSELSGLILGMTLTTRAPDIYRALIEATAYGTRTIINAYEESGVPIKELVIAGGLIKNKLLMQIYADVTGRDLSVAASSQGSALGSAIHAAVAAEIYPDIYAAAAAMGKSQVGAYTPNLEHQRVYDALYAEYQALHDYFGRGANEVMKRLKSIRNAALQAG
jgi:L-ribulokinase